jgi:hypothetical protein
VDELFLTYDCRAAVMSITPLFPTATVLWTPPAMSSRQRRSAPGGAPGRSRASPPTVRAIEPALGPGLTPVAAAATTVEER